MGKTGISWTGRGGYTVNFWWGCSEIGPECGIHGGGETGFCYAATAASRNQHPRFAGLAESSEWSGRITRASAEQQKAALKFKPGNMVFTCSMSDFWHEDVPLAWLNDALNIIEQTPWLIWLILTRRPSNIHRKLAQLRRKLPRNVWQGVSIGHEQSIPLLQPLLQVDASLLFLNCEPLLTALPGLRLNGIDWVIAGGQSGPGAARCNPDWMRAVRDLCVRNRVPFFLKQWGTWKSNPTPRDQELAPEEHGGATLDRRLWRQFPQFR